MTVSSGQTHLCSAFDPLVWFGHVPWQNGSQHLRRASIAKCAREFCNTGSVKLDYMNIRILEYNTAPGIFLSRIRAAAAPTDTNSSSTMTETSSSMASDTDGRRLETTTVCLPIVYGSEATALPKKADDFNTHEWTLYIKGLNNSLQHVVEKVIFQLHPSFAQPTREMTEPPFRVTERGWGEFEAQIKIVWKDPSEQATSVRAPIVRRSILATAPHTTVTYATNNDNFLTL